MNRPDPPYWAAALTAFLVFGLYVSTLAPTSGFWDAGEYISSAHILGIPHPPGNPLFVVLAKVWLTLLSPTGLSVAVRMNLFAAFTSAAAGGFFFLVSHRVLQEVVQGPRIALVGAAVATLLGSTAFTVWDQSTLNEKVYTLSVLIIAVVTWLAVRWLDRRDDGGSERLLLIAIYLMALGSTSHLMSVLAAPALGLIVLLVGLPVLFRIRFWARAIPLVILGLSFNFFLPVRAAQDPMINKGEPVCESLVGATAAIYRIGDEGCPALGESLSRAQYAKPPVGQRSAPLSHQLENWFQYFDWQWARGASPSQTPGNRRLPLTLLFLTLGAVGLWVTARADRYIAIYLATLLGTLTVGLVAYLNFKYGYSLAPEIADPLLHEVRERDYFFIAGFMLCGVLAGIGLAWAWDAAAQRLAFTRPHLVALPLLSVAAIPLALNWSWASRAGDYAAVEWAYDILMSVEPYGILFTDGDNETLPLWYAQHVEGLRGDVTVVVSEYLQSTWHPRQLQSLTSPERQRPLDLNEVGGLYTDPSPPRSSIIGVTPEQMDAIVGGVLEENLTVRFPQMAVALPKGLDFDRAERLALSIIRHSIGQRPIYFMSSGGMMNRLGLVPWGVRQGIVVKLDLRRLDAPPPARYAKASEDFGGQWWDYESSLALYEDVYRYRDLKERAVWSDRATSAIPLRYYAMALQLAHVGLGQGMESSDIDDLRQDARMFLVTARGGRKGSPEPPEG